jgi:hypothetical protein
MKPEAISPKQRLAEKEHVRRADAHALKTGAKSMAELKAETEAFAFPRSRTSINLASAKSLS